MNNKIITAQEIRDIKISELPVGKHKGIWGGYIVTFMSNEKEYKLSTALGIRTPGAKCVVTVKDGEAIVELV